MALFLLFVAVPILEIALFIQVGGFLGLWPTLLIVVLTALLGTILVRAQGLMAMNDIRSNLSNFRDPTESLAHGAMILAAGLLLLTPGFFTDALGFSLLLPPIRLLLLKYLKTRFNVQSFVQTEPENMHRQGQYRPDAADDIVEGEYKEIDPQPTKPTHRPSSGWTRH